MEEVDNIIIDSLRNIGNCDVDEDIGSLRDFTAEMIFNSIVCCLETITPSVRFSHKLPPTMSLRLKLATNVAEHIMGLGYRGDMGYQTILYCNEAEVRRVLMFLVERLPRDTSKSIASEELGYVPRLVKEIEESIRLSFDKLWVPVSFLKDGVRDCGKTYLKQNYGYNYPLHTENIRVPRMQGEYSEAFKQYWVHSLPDVTKQCKPENLIPSLLFKDSEFSLGHVRVETINDPADIKEDISIIDVDASQNVYNRKTVGNEIENQIEAAIVDVKETKIKYEDSQTKLIIARAKLAQLTNELTKKQTNLKESSVKIKTKSKALAIMSSEENMEKLKSLVENGTTRLVELVSQWNVVQAPLLVQCHELQENLDARESNVQSEQLKLENLKEKKAQLISELREKEILEHSLIQEYEKLNKNTNRSAYTRRILEIIANIKKQSEEIRKILDDTKSVQKEINNLNGQLDRSFLLSDELIFRDAKRDEMARKAYKLLATLHKDAGQVVQCVTELGLVERECRNLQEQVDVELARETSTKLERVNADLSEVKRENELLNQQIKGHA